MRPLQWFWQSRKSGIPTHAMILVKQIVGNDDSSNGFNIDFETIMKLKSVMDKMNSKDDPRAKLLISLKPYLKDSRKNKVDQYIQFFNMSKIMGMFTNGDGKL